MFCFSFISPKWLSTLKEAYALDQCSVGPSRFLLMLSEWSYLCCSVMFWGICVISDEELPCNIFLYSQTSSPWYNSCAFEIFDLLFTSCLCQGFYLFSVVLSSWAANMINCSSLAADTQHSFHICLEASHFFTNSIWNANLLHLLKATLLMCINCPK